MSDESTYILREILFELECGSGTFTPSALQLSRIKHAVVEKAHVFNNFAVFSYDPDQQQWFTDIVPAENAEAAGEYICKLRPYVTETDVWTAENLVQLADNVKNRTTDEAFAELQNVAEGSDVVICRTCNAVYDGYGDGYDGECPECADKTEEKRDA